MEQCTIYNFTLISLMCLFLYLVFSANPYSLAAWKLLSLPHRWMILLSCIRKIFTMWCLSMIHFISKLPVLKWQLSGQQLRLETSHTCLPTIHIKLICQVGLTDFSWVHTISIYLESHSKIFLTYRTSSGLVEINVGWLMNDLYTKIVLTSIQIFKILSSGKELL